MGVTLLPDIATEILIPACAVVGIAFSLLQWLIVSRVKVSPGNDSDSANSGAGKNGYADYLLDEEEGLNDPSVVLKCAEIQNAISEGLHFHPSISIFSIFSCLSLAFFFFFFSFGWYYLLDLRVFLFFFFFFLVFRSSLDSCGLRLRLCRFSFIRPVLL
jgi:hypothetical protein